MDPVAAPLSKFNEHITALNKLLESGRKDEILVATIKKSANKEIMKIDPASAHVLLGVIASYEQKPVDVVRYHFEAAIRFNPDEWVAYQNYAVSLGQLGFVESAYQISRRALDAGRTNQETLSLAVGICAMNGVNSFRFHEAAELGEPNTYVDFLNEHSISDSDMIGLAGAVEKVASRNHFVVKRVERHFYEIEKMVDLRFVVAAPAEVVSRLADELIDELVELDLPPKVNAFINVGFKCA